jgi:hypothetical protein
MRPLSLVLMVVIMFWLALLLGLSEFVKRWKYVCLWIGTIFMLLLWIAFSDSLATIGPASWADVEDDWNAPVGYSQHSVETSISMDGNWIVGETKECKSYPLSPMVAKFVGDEPGYAAGYFHCDDGPTHKLKVTFYGRYNQPEHQVAYWNCTRESDKFTCRQTGAE